MDQMLRDRDRVAPLLAGIIARMTTAPLAGTKPGTFLSQRYDPVNKAFGEGNVQIWSRIPKDLLPPYVAMASAECKPWGSKTRAGNEITLNMVVVSNFIGMDETNAIGNKLLDALSRPAIDLSADGLEIILFRPTTQSSGVLGEDGKTEFRRLAFRVIVVDTAAQSLI